MAKYDTVFVKKCMYWGIAAIGTAVPILIAGTIIARVLMPAMQGVVVALGLGAASFGSACWCVVCNIYLRRAIGRQRVGEILFWCVSGLICVITTMVFALGALAYLVY